MPRPALRVKVSQKDQAALKKILAAGAEQIGVTLRAVALQRLGEGMSAPQIADRRRAADDAANGAVVRNLARRYRKAAWKVRSMTNNGPERLLLIPATGFLTPAATQTKTSYHFIETRKIAPG